MHTTAASDTTWEQSYRATSVKRRSVKRMLSYMSAKEPN